jgi:hypothetical protein
MAEPCRITGRAAPRPAGFLSLVVFVWLMRSCRSWTSQIIQRRWRRMLSARSQQQPNQIGKSLPSSHHLPRHPARIPDVSACASQSRASTNFIELKASVSPLSSSSFNDGSWAAPSPSPPPVGNSHSHGNSYDIALCIVPPDEAWDTLQRARHVARDDSFTIWPPAIRLFHPIPDGMLDPLEVAGVVERYAIEPFHVHLNQWAVIPHAEVVAAQLEAVRASRASSDPSSDDSAPSARLGSDEDESRRAHFDALIEQEERLGRINKERRDQRALERDRGKRRAAEALTRRRGQQGSLRKRKVQHPK